MSAIHSPKPTCYLRLSRMIYSVARYRSFSLLGSAKAMNVRRRKQARVSTPPKKVFRSARRGKPRTRSYHFCRAPSAEKRPILCLYSHLLSGSFGWTPEFEALYSFNHSTVNPKHGRLPRAVPEVYCWQSHFAPSWVTSPTFGAPFCS